MLNACTVTIPPCPSSPRARPIPATSGIRLRAIVRADETWLTSTHSLRDVQSNLQIKFHGVDPIFLLRSLQEENRWPDFRPPTDGLFRRCPGRLLHRRCHARISAIFSAGQGSVYSTRFPVAVSNTCSFSASTESFTLVPGASSSRSRVAIVRVSSPMASTAWVSGPVGSTT